MAGAEELRKQAQIIRQSARYAQGETYHAEMAEAQQLENQANWLDNSKNETDTAGEDHG